MATLELEASGDAYVRLSKTDDAISWTNSVDDLNAIVVRSSLSPHPIDIAGVTVQGVGMWHAMLYRKAPNPLPKGVTRLRTEIKLGTNSILRDIAIDSNSVTRGIGQPGGGSSGVDNWLIQRVWVQHCDAQWLTGTDCRVSDSWGDDINLNNINININININMKRYRDGILISAGINLSTINNFVRGNGDDGLATYSDGGEDGKNTKMVNTKIINNNTVAPYWANALRVAGGINVEIKNNLCLGSASNSGMTVGIFGQSGNPLESTIIQNNIVRHGGETADDNLVPVHARFIKQNN